MRLFSLLLLIGCSSTPPCGPATCTGCCTPTGMCQFSTDSTSCGRGGAVCGPCGAGLVCRDGQCSIAQAAGGGSGSTAGGSGSTAGGSGMTAGGTGGTAGGTGGTAGGTGGTAGGTGGTAGGAGPSCPTMPVVAAMWSGGCEMHLVGPAPCATLDFSSGMNFEFDWSTNTTFCEGPHHLLVGGSPVSSWANGNYIDFSISSGQRPESGMTRNIGGYAFLNSLSLQGITSDTGVYYWRLQSYYGSASETRAFIRR